MKLSAGVYYTTIRYMGAVEYVVGASVSGTEYRVQTSGDCTAYIIPAVSIAVSSRMIYDPCLSRRLTLNQPSTSSPYVANAVCRETTATALHIDLQQAGAFV